jgi:hypothetical protein
MKTFSAQISKKFVFALLPLVLIGCKKAAVEDETVFAAATDPVEYVVESGVSMLSGVADDQTSATYAGYSSKMRNQKSIWSVLFGESAVANNCLRAFQSTCISGVQSATYSNCNPIGTSRTLNGSVTLSYSHMSCTLTTVGDSVNRTYDLSIFGVRGGQIQHSSNLASDYRGPGMSYGGGGKLTRTAIGWDLEILGRHSNLQFRDRELMNVSVRTLSPVAVTGALSRQNRTMNGGAIEVNHNLAQFTTTMVPSNLRWSNSCCHPVSGSLALSFSGSKTGSAAVTFQGCNSIQLDRDGQTSLITMSYCE